MKKIIAVTFGALLFSQHGYCMENGDEKKVALKKKLLESISDLEKTPHVQHYTHDGEENIKFFKAGLKVRKCFSKYFYLALDGETRKMLTTLEKLNEEMTRATFFLAYAYKEAKTREYWNTTESVLNETGNKYCSKTDIFHFPKLVFSSNDEKKRESE